MGEPATLEVGMTEADFSNKILGVRGAIIISAWITHKDKGAMTSLNLANSYLTRGAMKDDALWRQHPENDGAYELDMSGVIALANALPAMGVLSVTNVMGNRIGMEQLAKLQEIMRSKPNLVTLCGIADDATEADLSGIRMDADDAAILASELPDKGALLSLNLSNCKLVSESSNVDVPTDLKAGELIEHEGKMRPISARWGSGYRVHILDGAIAVADAISDMRALSSANLLQNSISVEQAQELVEIMRTKENLTTLCGLSGEETELNFSNRYLGGGDVVLIANNIKDNEAMTSLNLASNCLCGLDEDGDGVYDASGTLCSLSCPT
jgi:hypothetical protein